MQNPISVLSQTAQNIAEEARDKRRDEITDSDAEQWIGAHEILAWLAEQADLRVSTQCIVADVVDRMSDEDALALLKGPLAAALKTHIAHDLAYRAEQINFNVYVGALSRRGAIVSNSNGYVMTGRES